MFCYLFIVETKNRTLEETAALFDGVDASDLLSHEVGTGFGVPPKEVRQDDEKYSESHDSGNGIHQQTLA